MRREPLSSLSRRYAEPGTPRWQFLLCALAGASGGLTLLLFIRPLCAAIIIIAEAIP